MCEAEPKFVKYFRGEISHMGEIRGFGILVGRIIYIEGFAGFSYI
jgi:hypothetical protein